MRNINLKIGTEQEIRDYFNGFVEQPRPVNTQQTGKYYRWATEDLSLDKQIERIKRQGAFGPIFYFESNTAEPNSENISEENLIFVSEFIHLREVTIRTADDILKDHQAIDELIEGTLNDK